MVVNQRARRYTSLTWKAENAMERLNIIQTVVEMTRAKTYLEIGVASGAIFFRGIIRLTSQPPHRLASASLGWRDRAS